MKNKELFTLAEALKAVGEHTGIKFTYAVAKNTRMLSTELEIFQNLLRPPEEFMKYDAERVELCKKYADKDEKDEPKMVEESFVILKRKEEFDKEVGKLREVHKEVLATREQKMKEFNKLMSEESNFKPYKIKMEDIPKEITAAELSGIFVILESSTEIKEEIKQTK